MGLQPEQAWTDIKIALIIKFNGHNPFMNPGKTGQIKLTAMYIHQF